MKGYQISNFLSLDNATNTVFKGFVMKSNQSFPKTAETHDPSLIIINTDTENGPGEHWCVAYIEEYNKGKAEFFDSFGLTPEYYGLGHLFLPFSYIVCTGKTVQSLSARTCGAHCLFFSYLRCRGHTMQEILNVYKNIDLNYNDDMVMKFIKQFGEKYKF